jgi:hypothetical protein
VSRAGLFSMTVLLASASTNERIPYWRHRSVSTGLIFGAITYVVMIISWSRYQ